VVTLVTTLSRILVANRGEIACRVMRTARRLGITSVAVYSDADRDALHVRTADEAVYLGPAAPAQSYLSIDRVIAAARRANVDAVHPGYGFLSENAAFAAACAEAGLIFIGPRPETIEQMGSKSAAKHLMGAAGVPVVPGYHGADQSDETLSEHADQIGYPLMIKAVAGGGGKGMRIVLERHEFAAALSAARREAKGAFADDAVLVERYIEQPRHIEFQVFGDAQGRVVHLHERECSIQRRYQKIIEETPSPFLDDATRDAMGAAAVAAARAVAYLNAGTIEFIVGADRQFYFMEMNTRLQVEHPVTELVTGLDLVEWQLRIAAGEPLPLAQDEIERRGHAIEARIYAENPARDFLPSTGRIEAFRHPLTGPGLRIDAAVEAGDVVTSHYDPMIAKLVVHSATREQACQRLAATLDRTAIAGPATNLDLLRRIARDPVFRDGDVDTRYIDANLSALVAPEPVPLVRLLAGAASFRFASEAQSAAESLRSPWSAGDGWQPIATAGRRIAFVADRRYELQLAGAGGRYEVDIDGETIAFSARPLGRDQVEITTVEPRLLTVTQSAGTLLVADDLGASALQVAPAFPVERVVDDERAHPGSPLPGRVVAVEVSDGDRVERGTPLVIVEGMKMEHTVRALTAGVVERVLVREGDQVEAEAPLVDIRPD
jgi:3-methylcrotonyl-CoA carboxylase alpha subunit